MAEFGGIVEETRKPSGGCARVAGIGCVFLISVVVLLVFVVMFNLDSIKESDWYRAFGETAEAAKQEFENTLEIREELAALYPTQEIRVNLNAHWGSQKTTKSLVVEFVNPNFDIPETETERFAKGIATEVATRYPEIERFDQVVISFVAEAGVGMTIKMRESFPFPTSEITKNAADGSETEEAI